MNAFAPGEVYDKLLRRGTSYKGLHITDLVLSTQLLLFERVDVITCED